MQRFEVWPGEEWAAIRHRGALWRLLRRQGDTAASREVYEQALAYHQTLTSPVLIAHSLRYLGVMAGPEGERERARRSLIESLAWGQEMEHRDIMVGSLQGLVELAVLEGEWEQAARLGGAASAHGTLATRSRPRLDQLAEEATFQAIRTALGEARFAAAWATGRRLSAEEVLCQLASGWSHQSGSPVPVPRNAS